MSDQATPQHESATLPDSVADTRRRYLQLLKLCLTRAAFPERNYPLHPAGARKRAVNDLLQNLLGRQHLELVRRVDYDSDARARGRDVPSAAETMVGLRRLDNLQECIETLVADAVPGDLIETGVWRGGTLIFMRAVLDALGDDRLVWGADSFRGLPHPNADEYPADKDDPFHSMDYLRVSLHEVEGNFRRYGVPLDGVRFLVGWFSETLPTAPMERLALLRMDGDMYESTWDALHNLYPRLSPGGYAIADDYYLLRGTRAAVDDYRAQNGITEPIVDIDGQGAYWRRDS